MASAKSAKTVLIRTYSAGVHFGKIKSRDGKEVTLAPGSRRIWNWRGANTMNEIAAHGIASGRVSQPAPGTVILTEAIEIIEMTPEAVVKLEGIGWQS